MRQRETAQIDEPEILTAVLSTPFHLESICRNPLSNPIDIAQNMQLARLSLALMALGTICCCSIVSSVTAFTGPAVVVARQHQQQQHRTISSLSVAANGEHDDSGEIVARRIVVKGDVQGGYYRSCVLNEVRV